MKKEVYEYFYRGCLALLCAILPIASWGVLRAIDQFDESITRVRVDIQGLYEKERASYERLGRIEAKVESLETQRPRRGE